MRLARRLAEVNRARLRASHQRASTRRRPASYGFEAPPTSGRSTPASTLRSSRIASRGTSPVGSRGASPSTTRPPLSARTPLSSSRSARSARQSLLRRFSRKASTGSTWRSEASARHQEDKDASFIGAIVRLVDLNEPWEHHNGKTGTILRRDVSSGLFVVTLGGEQAFARALNMQVLDVPRNYGGQSRRLAEKEDKKKDAASECLFYEAASALDRSPCARRSGSPAAKLVSGRAAVDRVPLSVAEKDRPPKKLVLTPWEEDAAATTLDSSPLLKRAQWPPRTRNYERPGAALPREMDSDNRHAAPALRRPPPAPPKKIRMGWDVDWIEELHKDAFEIWKDNGMPFDGANYEMVGSDEAITA